MLRLPGWFSRVGPVLFVLGLFALYRDAIGTRFLNDDYLFLEQARTQTPAESLTRLDALGNYYRPLSRQIYFAVLTPLSGGEARVFHAANFLIFLGGLGLLARLLGSIAPGLPALAGTLFFALLPLQRVNLTWISCAQDLLALFFSLLTLTLWRRGRREFAVAAYVAALASKEVALPLPLALVAWDRWMAKREGGAGESWPVLLRRQAPMFLAALAWGVLVFAIRARSTPQEVLRFDPLALPAAFAHLAQSLLGVEHPPGFLASFTRNFPEPLPAVLLALAGLGTFVALRPGESAPAADRSTAAEPANRSTATTLAPAAAPARGVIPFALAWTLLFTLVTWPVTHIWCGYYYTLAAVGAAILVTLLARRLDRIGWIALATGLLWWHAAGTGTRAFATENRPWGWTSHLTTFYFTRGAALADSISKSLRALEPSPATGTRFFFATLPPFAGFQMGNGALIRNLYRDPSLQSHFYSSFGDSTAGEAPCRFDFWDGVGLSPMYPGLDDPFFQVGCDLLLLDRPAGAHHAFRRSIALGGSREDNLYWLGWAALWSGDRAAAEEAWASLGARDDHARVVQILDEVRAMLYEGETGVAPDTLAARRRLLEAIRAGMGLPNAHAALGEMLIARGGVETKYGLLELKIARTLNPNDLLARRELIEGLASIRMDEAARSELASLRRNHPDWRSDSALVRIAGELERRRTRAGGVAEFE